MASSYQALTISASGRRATNSSNGVGGAGAAKMSAMKASSVLRWRRLSMNCATDHMLVRMRAGAGARAFSAAATASGVEGNVAPESGSSPGPR